jgi:rhamnulokinase
MSSPATHYLACDLGAESGRVMLGTLEAGRVTLQELHRFGSAVVKTGGSMRWDVLRIFEELKVGLKQAARLGIPISSVSTDSWGVDYVWVGRDEPFLVVPFHYRDARNDDAFARVFPKVSSDEIFSRTGIQFMPFNTLYQLDDDVSRRPWAIEVSDRFLNIADYFNALLGGEPAAEESLASTTQLYDPRTRAWDPVLAARIGLPERVLPRIVPSATDLGPMDEALARETGLSGVRVVAGCSHDTAAAVAAVPATGEDWAYLSSGTWSLLGVENPAPLISPESQRLGFTNETGLGGSTRFLKNIIGLWIVQECRRAWLEAGSQFDYTALVGLAESAPPLRSLIHPNATRFGQPGGMPEKIATFCRETGQPVPSSPGECIRCVLESLALLYRQTLGDLEQVSGRRLNRLHIVGGGSKNGLLNQLTADATGRQVLAGPVEATALGNVLVQALALGRLASGQELREVVRASCDPVAYEPHDRESWEAAALRFATLPCQ